MQGQHASVKEPSCILNISSQHLMKWWIRLCLLISLLIFPTLIHCERNARYDPNKGSKAFSYFSVITKNWFIHKVKRQQKRNKREVDFNNISKSYEEEFLSTSESYITEREEEEFWKSFYSELKSWDASSMKENDLRVYQAINILFESKEDIDIFNKKAIYLYLREITGLNTKQIVNSLKKFRKKYYTFKDDWENGNL